jgi:hypothetical protein
LKERHDKVREKYGNALFRLSFHLFLPFPTIAINVMKEIDIALTQFDLCDQLRANSSFMKVMATLFYYGNQTMSAAQLVIAVRALELLPLR